MGRKLRKWVLGAGLWAVSSLTAQALRAATGEDLPKQGTVREEQGFKLRKEHDSLYWLNDWRLPYPVYQFQTGDVDGDGRADAMVGVVKSTRFYPEKARRLFIFKQVISTAAHSKGQVKARPLWLGSKLGGILEDFRYVAPAEGDSMGRIRALESTTDSLYVVTDYRWESFGMKFDQIDVEKLLDSIDYDIDVSGLSLADVRTLANAPAAQRGLPFMDAYIRGIYSRTTWYDSLMMVFDDNMQGVDPKEGESWRDAYMRSIKEHDMLKYNDVEKAFIQRMEAREAELKKQNFEVAEGLRVNMQNLLNPTQLKEFDPQLSQKLGEEGFAIVPARNAQLFQVYEENDYNEFPNFVTTDLYLQLYHLYIDCMLREVEEHKLLPMMVSFCQDMYQVLYNMERWAGDDETVKRIAHHNATYYNIAHRLFTGKYILTPDGDDVAMDEVRKATDAVNSPSFFMEDYHEIPFPYSLFRPRGHYTRTEGLQRYFRGMMWLQTVPFGMDNKDEVLAAIQQACALKSDKGAQKNYNTLNQLITFLMGDIDNLSLPQVMAEVEKTGLQMEELMHNDDQRDAPALPARRRGAPEHGGPRRQAHPARYAEGTRLHGGNGCFGRRADTAGGEDRLESPGRQSEVDEEAHERDRLERDHLHPVDEHAEGAEHLDEGREEPALLHGEPRVVEEGSERSPRLVGRAEARRHPLRQATYGC